MSRSYIGRVSVATPSKTQQRAILRGLKAWHGYWDNDRQPYVREHDGRFLVDFPFTLGGGFGVYPASKDIAHAIGRAGAVRELTLGVIDHEQSPLYAKWDEDEVTKDGSAVEGSYTRPLKEPTEVELSIEGTGEIDDREDAVRAALASLPWHGPVVDAAARRISDTTISTSGSGFDAQGRITLARGRTFRSQCRPWVRALRAAAGKRVEVGFHGCDLSPILSLDFDASNWPYDETVAARYGGFASNRDHPPTPTTCVFCNGRHEPGGRQLWPLSRLAAVCDGCQTQLVSVIQRAPMERGVLDQDGQPTHLQRRSGLPLDVRCLVCGRSSEETLVVKGEHIESPEGWAEREKQSARTSAEVGAAEARGATSEEVVKIMMRPPRMSSADRSPKFYGLCRDDLLRAKELSTEFVNSVREAAAAPPP